MRRNKKCTPNTIEPELRTIVEVAPMADNRTIQQLLQAPMEGYREAIVIPEINADHFEIKTNLLQLVQANPYHDHPLKNEISRFTQRFEETFEEAWERFKEMLRACPHHGFTELTQIDTFYNGLNENDQDSLNVMAGGNILIDIFAKKVVTPAAVKAMEESCFMRARNSYFPNNSFVTISMRRNKKCTPNIIEPELRTIIEVAPMADNRTIQQLLQAPMEGYREAIVIPEINADHFEIKTNLLQLVQANPYHGFERENPYTHIKNFKWITSTFKFKDVPNDMIKLMKFPYSLEGTARVWYDKESFNSILTWEDLAWERFKEMLRACPHHGFTELTQIDTFYNGLNENDQDSLNAMAGGNILSKTTREALHIIENKSKAHYSRNKLNVSRINTTSRENASNTDDRIDKLTYQISTLVDIFAKKVVTPAAVKAMEESCVTCGDSTSGTLLSNTILNSKGEMKEITNRSGVAYKEPSTPTPKKVVKRETEETTDKEQTNFQGSTAHIQPPVVPILKPDSLLANKDKLFELAKIPLNENCSVMLLKKLHEKLGYPDKLLIPSDQSINHPKGVAEDVFVKVGKFHFPTDFVVVDFEADPWVKDEAVTFNLNQTTRYSSTYDDMSVNRIHVIDVAREEYAQEMLGFSNNSLGGNPTSTSEPIISDSSPSLTPFEGSDFILKRSRLISRMSQFHQKLTMAIVI
nr:reverse transcriptase domain-containing protein [Tanacetum cinerariifolium]